MSKDNLTDKVSDGLDVAEHLLRIAADVAAMVSLALRTIGRVKDLGER